MAVVTVPVLKLAVFQFAPRLRAAEANLKRIGEAVASADADVVLTPELSVTGYDLGDDAATLATPLVMDGPLPCLSAAEHDPLKSSTAHSVLGLVEKGAGGTPYNAAVVCQRGAIRFKHRKLYLPTYGMFDEARFFGRGASLDCFDVSSHWRLGILICEDFWHPGLAYVLASAGIHALLVLAAAPGRGVWEGGEDGGMFASASAWERIARVTAQLYGIYVALANRTGIEGGVTFAGGSLIVGPDGALLARAGELQETTLAAELSQAEIERARRPYAHARDDDPRLVGRELRRLTGV